jgi:preprotein translocase subunit SecA
MESTFEKLGDEKIESKMITKSISNAQKRVEGVNFDARKSLLQYDDVMRQQREIMYDQRNFILENDDVHSVIHDMFHRVISDVAASNVDPESRAREVDVRGLQESLDQLGFKDLVDVSDLKGKSAEDVTEAAFERAWKVYNDRIAPVKERILPLEKQVSLNLFDRAWSNHIDIMSKLRDGIGLRSYAQNNPLQAYVQEGYELFEDMMQTISREIVAFCMNIRVASAEDNKEE